MLTDFYVIDIDNGDCVYYGTKQECINFLSEYDNEVAELYTIVEIERD